jgi:hypothetical protein
MASNKASQTVLRMHSRLRTIVAKVRRLLQAALDIVGLIYQDYQCAFTTNRIITLLTLIHDTFDQVLASMEQDRELVTLRIRLLGALQELDTVKRGLVSSGLFSVTLKAA